MTNRPILFSAPMVRALLDGSKTQTRRVVKPTGAHHLFQFRGTTAAAGADEPTGDWGWCGSSHFVNKYIRCPYGKPGDRLWVRETWGVADKWLHDCETDPPRCIAYRADLAARNFDPVYDVDTSGWAFAPHMKWHPSIHMPRWASRITLEITGVRVERLQDISEEDADAEGVSACDGMLDTDEICRFSSVMRLSPEDSKPWYAALWESINGPGSWDTNPWVWVVEFKRVEGGAQ